jgi:D-sedoheptulose 7-phosphate isomerase
MIDMKEKIQEVFRDSIAVKKKFLEEHLDVIVEVSQLLADTFTSGRKLLLFGNGGSATDASHIAAEFVNRFRMERPAFPAIALNTDMAVITSIANDYDYAQVFARQLKALAQEGDVAIAISTSGASPNIINAVSVARHKKVKTVAFTGAKGDELASICDYVFAVPSSITPRVQETHSVLGHVLCQMVEEILFEAYR